MDWLEVGALITALVAVATVIITIQRYNSGSRNRIYARLDACKRGFEDKMSKDYVRKDIYTLTHTQVEKKLKEIETQTALIPNIAAKLEVLINKQGGMI